MSIVRDYLASADCMRRNVNELRHLVTLLFTNKIMLVIVRNLIAVFVMYLHVINIPINKRNIMSNTHDGLSRISIVEIL